jgi:hypothetical protein
MLPTDKSRMFWNEQFSMGDPVLVVQRLLQFLDETLTRKVAHQRAQAIVASIPNFVADPKEWSWHGTVMLGRDEAITGIQLEAIKPKRRWRCRVPLPENSH